LPYPWIVNGMILHGPSRFCNSSLFPHSAARKAEWNHSIGGIDGDFRVEYRDQLVALVSLAVGVLRAGRSGRFSMDT
jgi:hypothetical protein